VRGGARWGTTRTHSTYTHGHTHTRTQVLKKLNPILLTQKLHAEADRLDAASETSYDAFLSGSLPLEKFTAEHVQVRRPCCNDFR
jgi:hypothetical protein